jgi:hypothetical protein
VLDVVAVQREHQPSTVSASKQQHKQCTATLHIPSAASCPRNATLSMFWGSEGGSLLLRPGESSQQYHTILYALLFTTLPPHVRPLSRPFSPKPISRSHDRHKTFPPPPHPLQRPAKLPHTINVPSTVADIVTAPTLASTSHAVFPVVLIIGHTPLRNERIVA